jgi:hypothetical protein
MPMTRRLAGAQQGDQLVEDTDRERVVGRLPGDGDLVAAHVHVGLDLGLDQAQQLVGRPQQGDHRDGVGNGDGGPDRRLRRAGGRSGRTGSGDVRGGGLRGGLTGRVGTRRGNAWGGVGQEPSTLPS